MYHHYPGEKSSLYEQMFSSQELIDYLEKDGNSVSETKLPRVQQFSSGMYSVPLMDIPVMLKIDLGLDLKIKTTSDVSF